MVEDEVSWYLEVGKRDVMQDGGCWGRLRPCGMLLKTSSNNGTAASAGDLAYASTMNGRRCSSSRTSASAWSSPTGHNSFPACGWRFVDGEIRSSQRIPIMTQN